MSLRLYAENNDGDVVEYSARMKQDTLEVTTQAAEASVGASTIIIDDPGGTFYIRGLKPLYLVETDAITDTWFGVIGLYYAWNRVFMRGPYRTGAGREVHISVNDINTLLTRRLQKGTDAKRPQENDTTRVIDWLAQTAEVIGGQGDSGFAIEDFDYAFTDSPVPMDKTDYTAQDSAGVINDALQDSGKNSYLFNSPLADQAIRVGLWYGRTERTDYSSPHRISNIRTDVNIDHAQAAAHETPEDLIAGEWTFYPSLDATLDRDPSRVADGVMVQFDGGYAYETRPATGEQFENRDMVMQAELVKTHAQAVRRAQRYLRDLRNEDDAIECAVLVPSALVNAFKEGQRVEVRFSHLPGYSAGFVWMRVASRTVRQVAGDSKIYEIALDLRAEEPPDSEDTGSGALPCIDVNGGPTESQHFDPLGGSGPDTPNPSPGNVFYLNPGESYPVVPTPGHVGHVHFPTYAGPGGNDTWGECCQNRLRIVVVGDGTLTIGTVDDGSHATLLATLSHWRYGADGTGGVAVIDSQQTGITPGDDIVVNVSTHDGANCTHWVDIHDSGATTCGGGWGFSGADWVLDS